MTTESDSFDAFVSYFEETGKCYAETIRDNLKRYSITTFVAHIERRNYIGSWVEKVNRVIANCRYFILLISIDTLGREEIVRECRRAYPNGLTEHPKFVIFREDLELVERQSESFLKQTGINISTQNQHDFRNGPDLATRVTILCRKTELVRLIVAAPQAQEQHVADATVTRNRKSVEAFLNKVGELALWQHFEAKIFLFRCKSNEASWKVQFLYIELLEHTIPPLVGLATKHLRFTHLVRGIDELSGILNQIASAKDVTLDNTSVSLELTPEEITYDSFYESHPQGEIFGLKEAFIEMLKSGNNSAELAKNQRLLVSELEGLFDNLPDAVVNTLGLSFWDGTYSPFVVALAPIPIKITAAEINNQRILMTLDCSPLIEIRRLRVMLHGRNLKGRQVGSARPLVSFKRSNDRQISLNTNILLDNAISHLTLRLYYHDDLVQEEYFRKGRTSNEWLQN